MNKPKANFAPLDDLLAANATFDAIIQAAQMGVFDALAEGPSSAEQVADRLHTINPPTRALLELLSTAGIVEQQGDSFANTTLSSEYLVSTSPYYQGMSLNLHRNFNGMISGQFENLLKGEHDSRAETDSGWGVKENMDGTAQHARLGALQDTVEFATALPGFEKMTLMGDIGGNHGEFSKMILEKNHGLHGEILDLPEVVPSSSKRVEQYGLEDRLHAMVCDLRSDEIPDGKYDLLLASHVLYAFADDMDGFAKKLHKALKPGGWFVAHHLRPGGGLSEMYINYVQFITRMGGYPTHFLGREMLEESFGKAGFGVINFEQGGYCNSAWLMAAQA